MAAPDGGNGGEPHHLPATSLGKSGSMDGSGPTATTAPPAPEFTPEPRTSPPLSDDSLDRSLARGLAWTAGAKWGSQIFTWITTLLVARLLTPDDYGLVGMAVVFTGLVALVGEFGLGTAVITLRDLTRRQLAQINSLALLLGFVALGVTGLAAVPLARFFAAPELVPVVLVYGVTFVVAGLHTVPLAAMKRDLEFGRVSVIEIAVAVVSALATLLLALAGLRYWALVLGNVFGHAVRTGLFMYFRPHPFARPDMRELRQTFTFSSDVLISRLAWYAYSNADFLIAGRVLGRAPLGAYTMAWTLASMPIEKITALVTTVTPSVFGAVQDRMVALRRYMLALTEGLALVTLPATIGMVLVADEFVRLILGEQWIEAILPLQLLGVYASFRSLVTLLPQILIATRQTRFPMVIGVAMAIVMPVAFYVGSHWGPEGIAAAWIIVYPLLVIPLYVRVFRTIDLSFGGYLRCLWPAINATLLMTLVVIAARLALPLDLTLATRLLSLVAVGLVAYFGSLYVFHRERLNNALATLRLLKG